MKCYKPFLRYHVAYRCNQCLACRSNRRRTWTARLMLESLLHPASFFCTLTYDKDHLPEDLSVSVREGQDFMKRLRTLIAPRLVRFYLVGEYGDQSQRPHYHVILFGDITPEDIQKSWTKGFSHIGELTHKSASYTVSYVVKSLTKVTDPRLLGRAPEFARMSLRPGLGHGALAQIAERLQGILAEDEDVPGIIRSDGQIWPIGAYLRKGLRCALGRPKGSPAKSIIENMDNIMSRFDKLGFRGVDALMRQQKWNAERKTEIRRSRKEAQIETI